MKMDTIQFTGMVPEAMGKKGFTVAIPFMMFSVPQQYLGLLSLTLLLGTPVMVVIGGIGAALTMTTRQGGVLVALLVLPMYVPVLIFGSGVLLDVMQGFAVQAHLALLLALALFAISFGPVAIAVTVKLLISE